MGRKAGTGIFTRQRKGGPVHYIDFVDQHGKRRQEKIGSDKAKARRVLAQRRREVADGTYSAEFKSGSVTLASYAETWGKRRTNKTAGDDRAKLRDHIVPVLGQRTLEDLADDPHCVKVLVDALKAKGTIEDKTIRNVVGVMSSLFRDAKFEKLVHSNPCSDLPKGIVPPAVRKPKDIYEPGPLATLLTSEKVPLDRRVFYTLLALTGERHGEGAGRRWRDLDWNPKPLASLHVHSQYYDEPLKSPDGVPRPRMVPVHPELARVLREWQLSGFARYFGRPPKPDDFIVPSRRGPSKCRTVRRSLHNLVDKDCPKAGVDSRTIHRFRDTFISLTRRGDAPKDKVKLITHGDTKGDIIDAYSNIDWDPLCRTVLCLKVDLKPAEVIRLPVPKVASGDGGKRDVLRDAADQNDGSQPNQAGFVAGRTGLEDGASLGTKRNARGFSGPEPSWGGTESSTKQRLPSTSDARHAIDHEAEDFEAAVAEDFEAAVAEDAERAAAAEVIRRG